MRAVQSRDPGQAVVFPVSSTRVQPIRDQAIEPAARAAFQVGYETHPRWTVRRISTTNRFRDIGIWAFGSGVSFIEPCGDPSCRRGGPHSGGKHVVPHVNDPSHAWRGHRRGEIGKAPELFGSRCVAPAAKEQRRTVVDDAMWTERHPAFRRRNHEGRCSHRCRDESGQQSVVYGKPRIRIAFDLERQGGALMPAVLHERTGAFGKHGLEGGGRHVALARGHDDVSGRDPAVLGDIVGSLGDGDAEAAGQLASSQSAGPVDPILKPSKA
ncbi:hypothetical protein BHAOGJBA_1343 [Methylobacterium hispanicum]|uniref:Uncharacterized protein n=1 Tax=Methylobacterium hispanicum TaxID=270350 RepID=A0AAV4ZI31_9HYPH|nr:hypothetical protein BHAOGJBA_1343 [Methylobacterium hispanicum]